jgi:hypothetical protein
MPAYASFWGRGWKRGTRESSMHMCRVGQNRIYTPYMTVYLVIFLPKKPYTHRVYMVLANPRNRKLHRQWKGHEWLTLEWYFYDWATMVLGNKHLNISIGCLRNCCALWRLNKTLRTVSCTSHTHTHTHTHTQLYTNTRTLVHTHTHTHTPVGWAARCVSMASISTRRSVSLPLSAAIAPAAIALGSVCEWVCVCVCVGLARTL